MLVLARKINESIMIGDEIEIVVIDIKGDQIKLGIKAPRRIAVHRKEIYEEIQAENRAAMRSDLNKNTLRDLSTLIKRDNKNYNRKK